MKNLILALTLTASAWAQQVVVRPILAKGQSGDQNTVYLSIPLPYGPTTDAPVYLYVDNEVQSIIGAMTADDQFYVVRGILGTTKIQHVAGSKGFVGKPNQFVTTDKVGSCDPNSSQYINYTDQTYFICTAGTWVPYSTNAGGGGGGSSVGPVGSIQTAAGSGLFGYLANPLPVVDGGTGSMNPPGVTGTSGITCTGTFPSQTCALTGAPTVFAGTFIQDIPTGTLNGTNPTFGLSQTPNSGLINLYRNGIKQRNTVDYTLTGTTITFLGVPGPTGAIPNANDVIEADYLYGTGGGGGGGGINAITINGGAVPPNALLGTNSAMQPVDLGAAVLNSGGKAVLRDNQNALDVGNISSAISACGISTPCPVFMPPSYTQSDPVPGTSASNWFDGLPPSPITTSANISFLDQRWGGNTPVALNCPGYGQGAHWCNQWQYDYINPTNLRVFDNVGPLVIVSSFMDGGRNDAGMGLKTTDKLNEQGPTFTGNCWTPGQCIGNSVSINKYSLGDALITSHFMHTWGGPNADSDEANEIGDNEAFAGGDEPTGTVSSYTFPLLTASAWTHGQGHQGAGRFIIKENAGTVTTGTVVGINSPGNGPTVVAGTGTGWTASTVIGTLGTNVIPPVGTSGVATVTPTFSTGSIAGITTSSLVCVGGSANFEMVIPSAVSGGTFTATFRKVHMAADFIGVGGNPGCGFVYSLDFENASNSNSHTISRVQNIDGTLHNVIPILYVSDATHLSLWYSTSGHWDVWQFLMTSTMNTYTAWRGAELTTVQYQGSVGNTMTLGPNNVGFTGGDTFGVPAYFAKRLDFGFNILESYLPDSAFISGGFNIAYNKPMGGNNVLFGLSNNTDPILYTGPFGLVQPAGITESGPTKWGLNLDTKPAYWVLGVGCPSGLSTDPAVLAALPCNASVDVLHMSNGDAGRTGLDHLYYSEAAGTENWSFSTGNGTGAQYFFYPNVFQISAGGSIELEGPTSSQSALLIHGTPNEGVHIDNAPLLWGYREGCPVAGCSSTVAVIAAANSTYYDFLDYDETGLQWKISTANNSLFYAFGGTGLQMPVQVSLPTCDIGSLGRYSNVGYLTSASTLQYCTIQSDGMYHWVNPGMTIENLAYSATPTLNPMIQTSRINLTGNVSSWTLSVAGLGDGQKKTIMWCQDTTGGRTVSAAPSDVKGFTAITNTTANTCAIQTFTFSFLTDNEWIADGLGIQGVAY